MSVADKLGTGSSFGQVPRGRSARGRAKAVAQGDVPTYELVRLHLDEVSPTPLNPRRNFGSDEDKTRFGEELRQAQLAACVAVTRGAYLALWPDHASRIGEAQHVLVNGERRFHSAVHVGLDALDFVVRDDLASSREEFINHLLKENLEREDFDVIERARGVQELVEVCAEKSERGSRTRAAERLGKDRSWVTNQLALLELPTEIQAMLSSGDLPERDGRTLARHCKENPGLDAAELLEHLKIMKALASQTRAEEQAVLQAVRKAGAPTSSSLLSADNKPAELTKTAGEITAPESLLSADNKSVSSPPSSQGTPTERSDSVAEAGLLSADNKPAEQAGANGNSSAVVKRSGASGKKSDDLVSDSADAADPQQGGQPRKLPYDDPAYVAMHLEKKMEPAVFLESTQLMAAKCWDKAGAEPSLDLLKGMLQTAAQRDPDSLRALLEQFTTEASTA